jgi:hypothetical protein
VGEVLRNKAATFTGVELADWLHGQEEMLPASTRAMTLDSTQLFAAPLPSPQCGCLLSKTRQKGSFLMCLMWSQGTVLIKGCGFWDPARSEELEYQLGVKSPPFFLRS